MEKKEEVILPLPPPVPVAETPKAIICSECRKAILDEKIVHNIEKISPTGIKEMVMICDECFQRQEEETTKKLEEIQASVENAKREKEEKEHKLAYRDHTKVLIWAIVIGLLGLGGVLATCIVFYKKVGIGWTIGLPLLAGYTLMANIYCLFSGTWVSDVFLEVSSWSIKMPGIIFTFDLEGLKFLIIMKIILGILSITLTICVLLLAFSISAICSFFSFPFSCVSNYSNL